MELISPGHVLSCILSEPEQGYRVKQVFSISLPVPNLFSSIMWPIVLYLHYICEDVSSELMPVLHRALISEAFDYKIGRAL